MKSWVKSLLIGLSITLISVSLLIGFLPSLLKPALNRWLPDILQTAGIENGSIHISHFSWRQLNIENLSLPLADGSYVALNNFSLNYSPTDIITGRLKSLDIKKLTLNLAGESSKKIAGAAAAGAKHAASEVLDNNPIIEIPAFKQWLSLPLNTVKIHQIDFQHPTLAATLEAQITPKLWRIWGETQLNNLPLPWQLETRLQQNGELVLYIKESEQLLTQLHANIDQDHQGTTHIRFSNVTDLHAISQRLLVDLNPTLPFTNASIASEITLPARFRFPQEVDFSTTVQINSVTNQKLNIQAEQASILWQAGTIRLTLDKSQKQELTARLYSQHELLLAAEQHIMQLQQTGNSPILTSRCNSDISHCDINGELPWQIRSFFQPTISHSGTAIKKHYASLKSNQNEPQQSLNLSIKPVLKWQQNSGINATVELQLKGKQQQAKLPRAEFSSRGVFSFIQDISGNWKLTSANGLSNQIRLQPYTLPAAQAHSDTPLADHVEARQLEVSDVNFNLLPQLFIARENQRWNFKPLKISADPFNVKLIRQLKKRRETLADINIDTTSLSCLPQLSDNQANPTISNSCDISLATLASEFQQWPVPDIKLSGPLDIVKALTETNTQPLQLSAALTLSAANQQLVLRSRLNHQQQQQGIKGSLQWHLSDTSLNWQALGLAGMTDLTQLQLLDGTLSGQGWIDWWQSADGKFQLKPDVTLRLDNVSAIYDNSFSLEKWRALFALRRPIDFSTDLPGDYLIDAQIAGDEVNTGISIRNILARSQTRVLADFSAALIDIHEIHTDLLGGRIYTPFIRFDTSKKTNAFTVEVNNIQLSELAKLEANAEVEATGVLDGTLPVVLSEYGVEVPGGTLFARQPGGVIRYNNATSQALKASDQTVGLALQLLENFQYNQLESGVDYQPDGNLDLALKFQGKNPDFFDGQATHLNVNLNYNLLDLMESLRITNDLIQKVEDKYQL